MDGAPSLQEREERERERGRRERGKRERERKEGRRGIQKIITCVCDQLGNNCRGGSVAIEVLEERIIVLLLHFLDVQTGFPRVK